jgi:hypothetical protein
MFINIYFLFLLFNIHILYSERELKQDFGNWYEKLQWWKKAKPFYDSIVKNYDISKKVKSNLDLEISDIKNFVDEFFKKYDLSMDEFYKRALNILNGIKKQKEELEDKPDDDQNEIEYEIAEKKEEIILAILNDYDNISSVYKDLDGKISDTLSLQIDRIGHYKDKALKNIKNIEEILDDKVVRSLYLQIENLHENSYAVLSYLQISFNNYLSSLKSFIKNSISNIEAEMKKLELDYNIYIRDLTEKEIQERQEKLEKEKARDLEKLKNEGNVNKDKQDIVNNNLSKGFWSRLFSFLGF